MSRVCRNQLPFDRKAQHVLQDVQLFHDGTRRDFATAMRDVSLNIHAPDLSQFHVSEEWPEMGFHNAVFAREGRRSQPCLLVPQKSHRNGFKGLRRRRSISERHSLFNARLFPPRATSGPVGACQLPVSVVCAFRWRQPRTPTSPAYLSADRFHHDL